MASINVEQRQIKPSAVTANMQYVMVSVIMFVLGMAAVFFVTYMRPEADNGATIAGILGFTVTATGSFLSFMKSQETHKSVNSRMDDFIRKFEAQAIISEDKARLEGAVSGRIEGRQIANDRTDVLAGYGLNPVPLPVAPPRNPVDTKLDEIATHTKETADTLKEIKDK